MGLRPSPHSHASSSQGSQAVGVLTTNITTAVCTYLIYETVLKGDYNQLHNIWETGDREVFEVGHLPRLSRSLWEDVAFMKSAKTACSQHTNLRIVLFFPKVLFFKLPATAIISEFMPVCVMKMFRICLNQ